MEQKPLEIPSPLAEPALQEIWDILNRANSGDDPRARRRGQVAELPREQREIVALVLDDQIISINEALGSTAFRDSSPRGIKALQLERAALIAVQSVLRGYS